MLAVNTISEFHCYYRFLFSECTRLTSVGGEKALAAMIGTMCQAVENEYGVIVTRLFRVFKPAGGKCTVVVVVLCSLKKNCSTFFFLHL